jgi:hypothetical protein
VRFWLALAITLFVSLTWAVRGFSATLPPCEGSTDGVLWKVEEPMTFGQRPEEWVNPSDDSLIYDAGAGPFYKMRAFLLVGSGSSVTMKCHASERLWKICQSPVRQQQAC